jgi:Sin3 associated polypeptide p18 (SAP18)
MQGVSPNVRLLSRHIGSQHPASVCAVTVQVGTVHASQPGEDDNKTLHEIKFQIGDFMDVAILVPNRAVPISGAVDRRFANSGQRRGPRGR